MKSIGESSELLAEKYNITKDELEDFAINSQKKSSNGIKNGIFKSQIIPIEIKIGDEIKKVRRILKFKI